MIASYEYELQPGNRQKSFYGKAVVDVDGGVYTLYSYGTPVARYRAQDGAFARLWAGYSATTLRHINAFRASFGLDTMSKAAWIASPVSKLYAHLNAAAAYSGTLFPAA